MDGLGVKWSAVPGRPMVESRRIALIPDSTLGNKVADDPTHPYLHGLCAATKPGQRCADEATKRLSRCLGGEQGGRARKS